jgi:hypothetical protein
MSNFLSQSQTYVHVHEYAIMVMVFLLLVAWTSIVTSLSADVSTFYVATNGKDSWSGRLPQPNSQQTDGPFATIFRARDAIREQTSKSIKTGVLIAPGYYELNESFVLTNEDDRGSGTTFKASDMSDPPVLSGGQTISGWKVSLTIQYYHFLNFLQYLIWNIVLALLFTLLSYNCILLLVYYQYYVYLYSCAYLYLRTHNGGKSTGRFVCCVLVLIVLSTYTINISGW